MSTSAPAILAAGTGVIQSSAKTQVWVSGNALVKNLSTDSTRWDMQVNGAARIYRGATAGIKASYYPFTLPSVLYGQSAKLTKLSVSYVCHDGTKGYIIGTYLNKQTDADSAIAVVSDSTDRTSNTTASYLLDLTTKTGCRSAECAWSCSTRRDAVQRAPSRALDAPGAVPARERRPPMRVILARLLLCGALNALALSGLALAAVPTPAGVPHWLLSAGGGAWSDGSRLQASLGEALVGNSGQLAAGFWPVVAAHEQAVPTPTTSPTPTTDLWLYLPMIMKGG